MKLLLKSPLNPHTGYGTDGLGLAQALTGMGVDVYLDPSYVQAPLPPHVAKLLTKRLDPPFDVLLHHQDPGQLGISGGARRASTLAVAWTMWEYTTLDNCTGRSTLKTRLKDYDAVIGYDTVSTGALRKYISGAFGTVQGGIWPDLWPAQRRDWRGKFRFCMVGALHQRKDPFAAIEAFKALRDEHPDFAAGAELHLKTVEPGLHKRLEEWAPGLFIHYETWSREQLLRFYAGMHVLLAPSRGEGKNAPALEFLCTGGTVIATNWGGHQQWLSESYAYPLNYGLEPVTKAAPNCVYAKADVEHLKTLMLHAFRNRAEAARKGATAAQVVPQMCSWTAVVDRLYTRIAELCPTPGRRLLDELRRSAEHHQNNPARVEQYA